MKTRAASDDGTVTPLFITFIEEWCRAFPEDREEVLNIFLATTAGRTVSVEPGRLLEKASRAGVVGDYAGYKSAAADYRKALSGLTEKVMSGGLGLGTAVGPELWVENNDFLIRTVLWSEEGRVPLKINLNTCSALDLMTFRGMTDGKAKAVIAARDQSGFFSSLKEAAKAGFER
jgi:DNA uptake protein ComE-like DNA-binding protein